MIETQPRMAYIARAACGCIRVATMDTPDHKKDNAREIAAAIRDGLTIERVEIESVRGELLTCKRGLPVVGRKCPQTPLEEEPMTTSERKD